MCGLCSCQLLCNASASQVNIIILTRVEVTKVHRRLSCLSIKVKVESRIPSNCATALLFDEHLMLLAMNNSFGNTKAHHSCHDSSSHRTWQVGPNCLTMSMPDTTHALSQLLILLIKVGQWESQLSAALHHLPFCWLRLIRGII